MYKLSLFFSRYNFVIIPAFLFLSLILLLKSSYYNSGLANYIVFDFLVTIPIVYFILIRKRTINKITIVSSFVIGIIMSSFLIPKEDQEVLSLVKNVVLPVVELGVLSYFIYKAKLVYTEFKKNTSDQDFFDAILIACKEVLPVKVAHFLATEIAVFYYVFFSWKKNKIKENHFTYNKEGTYNGVLLGLILVIFIETFVLHYLLMKVNIYLAWVTSIVSGYTLIQIVALFKSILRRPIYLDKELKKVVLRFGFTGYALIDFSNIEKVELITKDIEKEEVTYLSFLGSLAGQNILLHFKTPVTYEFFYGLKKTTTSLAFIVDDKKLFIDEIKLE